MAGLSKTYSGDFTSFVAGKLLNAAGMAKAESDRRETDNLQKARPGSLFTKALQSEFGGDLYNRTLGNFDPRKSAEETDRKSSKEKRYQAQFGDLKKTPKSDLDDAEKELLKDDDSIPVKDVDARKGLTKLFGVGLDSKLILANARVAGLSNDVKSVNDDLISTQKLIYDQNELLGSKFDQILGIFSAQQDYQKKIADQAEVKRREDELELEQDRSRTRKLESAFGGKKGKNPLGQILGVAADMLRGRGGGFVKKLLEGLGKKKFNIGGLARSISGAVKGVTAAGLDDEFRKFERQKQFFNRAKGFVSSKFTKESRSRAKTAQLKNQKAQKLADLLGVNATRLPDELRLGGLAALEDMYEMGMLDPKEFAETKKAAQKILKDTVMDGFPMPSANDPLMREIMEDREAFIQRRAPEVGKTPKMQGFDAPTINPKRMGREVTEELSSRAGAKALSEVGESAARKGLGKAGKFVPGLGTGIALTEAAFRFADGDTLGGIMSLGSALPILGWGFTAFDIARDLGFDPLNTLPQKQYERGTELTRPGSAILHGTEAVIGKKDRENMMDSYQQSIDQVGSTLVSSAVSLADSVGQGQAVKSELKKSGLSFDIVNMPTSSKIGKTGQLSVLSSLESDFKREIFSTSPDDPKSKKKEEDTDTENDPVDPNTVVPEYDLDFNEPNSAVQMGGRFYKTDANGAIGDEITEEEAKRIITRRTRASNPGRNGSYASGTYIGPAGDRDGEQTGLNMNLPGGIGTPIYAPVDLIYRSKGTDGNPAVGLQGDADAKGPAGRGFGYYGAYYFEKDGKEYEVLMGHFRDLPFKGSSEGQVIPKGTLIGYQGASGRSVSADNGIYPHISLHVNGIGFNAGNDVLRWFADGLAGGNLSNGNGGGGGGERKKAFHELAKDEALSSLTPGVNDWVKPGGRSVISNTPWESVTDDTLLYVYADSRGVPTLGYGSAAMRGITFGSSPITVRQAKAWLRDDINRITDGLSKNIKWWNSMTDDQRAGLIMFEYNAGEGNSYISSKGYPSLVRQLEAGNIRAAIEEIQREGPGQSRIDVEKELLRSGPQQIVGPKIVGPKIVGEGRVGAGIPFFPDLTIMKGVRDGLDRGKQRERNEELLKLLPMLDNRPNDLQSNSRIMEDMEEDSMVQQVFIINNVAQTTTSPLVISSSGGSNNDYVDQYRMAVLGA